jgi:hypothetical protein
MFDNLLFWMNGTIIPQDTKFASLTGKNMIFRGLTAVGAYDSL